VEEIFGRRDWIATEKLKRLSVKSDLRGFAQLGSHVAALALSGTALWATWGTLWMLPLFIIHGTLINFLYAGQHELSHWTVFRTSGLNEFFGRVFGWVLIYPRDFDQVQHFAHHRFTQDWQRDGELARAPYSLGSYVLWMLGISYWYTRVRRVLRFACGVVTCRPQAGADARGALAPGRLRRDRRVLGVFTQRAGARAMAAANAGDETGAPAAKYDGASWTAAHRFDRRQHPLHAHQRADALDGLEHAISHRASRVSRRAVPWPASAA
jgi:hypothetical protein